jgi:2,4-dienoyl-CoA reductase-like NADH-dependent reductase (Old Yellow Enzyme family)
MCQYSSPNPAGHANDWHLVHLGSRAAGGASLILTEDTAVLPDGRITPSDLGLWEDSQIGPLARIADFVHAQGAAFGIQLGYAGRKGSTTVPWRGGVPRGEGRALEDGEGKWETCAPSALAFGGNRSAVPREMSREDIRRVQQGFVDAAKRAEAVGADVIEFHAGWGYIFQQFYSPLSNKRTDEHGCGSFEDRIRFTLETVKAVREVWSLEKPLFVRIALTDWEEGGWTLDDAVRLAKELKAAGVDLVDGVSGAIDSNAGHGSGKPLMHVPMIKRVREEAGVATGANFGIETAEQAEQVLREGAADVVVVGRAMLRDPYWARHAADVLGEEGLFYPDQYEHWLSGRTR